MSTVNVLVYVDYIPHVLQQANVDIQSSDGSEWRMGSQKNAQRVAPPFGILQCSTILCGAD
mgnify:CR=1 FL=1